MDLLSQMLHEAQAYRKFDDIERLVESGVDLSVIPVQPLYLSLQTSNKDQVATILPKLSSEQRQALRDIDLWKKDQFDPEAGIYWIEVYSKVENEAVLLEFLKSEDFLLSIKSQFTVSTHDQEDPQYPEGDNFFITDDDLLMIEYNDDFTHANELKRMIKKLYEDMGVEYAYTFLFKMVADSFIQMEEENYNEKKERLRDYGFVDYFEALNFETIFPTKEQLDTFVTKKKGATGKVEALSLNQSLHASALVSYQHGLNGLKEELEKIKDSGRQQYLQFNFIRLVNGRITIEEALKEGSLALAQAGQRTKQALELGFDYIQQTRLFLNMEGLVFENYDFTDLYRVGHSLLEMTKKKIKKDLQGTPFEKEDIEFFLGMYWNSFLENSFEEITKYKFDGSSKAHEVSNYQHYLVWNKAADSLIESLPFIEKFFETIQHLKNENLLNDDYYLNYSTENIDFEAIIISSFINFSQGTYEKDQGSKMGISIKELKQFYHDFFSKNGEEYLIKGEEDKVLREKIHSFVEKFGLSKIPDFDRYLYQILLEQMNGYEVDTMSEEDFRHIGGPILLVAQSN